jgi:hypothetical protein
MIVEPDFLTHWKTRALAAALEDDRAPVYVIALWSHCQQRKTDRLERMPAVVLAQICGWMGDPERLMTGLISCGWLELVDDPGNSEDLIVHDFRNTNAKLFANWRNGPKGGRPPGPPKKPTGNPPENPPETDKKPTGNPFETLVKPTGNPPQTQSPNGLGVGNPPQTDRIDREEKIEKIEREKQPLHGEGIQYAEAKLWLNTLFQNKYPWSYEEDKLLDDLLPIAEETRELVSWAYSLPQEHRFHDSTMLKQSRLALLREFGSEVDKIRRVRSMMGLAEKIRKVAMAT